MDDEATTALDRFNKSDYPDMNLKTSNLILSDDYAITFVADLPGIRKAVDYYRTFNEKAAAMNELRNHKFDNFVITKDNFDIFYRTKGLDEYLQFFQKNYAIEEQ
jgi:hypothetical protein